MATFKLLGVKLYVVMMLMVTISYGAGCESRLLSLSLDNGTKMTEVLEQLADECSFSVIIKDDEAKNRLEAPLSKIHLKNYTLHEIFDVLLGENDLNFEYKNHLLKVSYLITKTFKVDYLASTRTSTGTLGVSLGGSSGSNSKINDTNGTTASNMSSSASSNNINITTEDSFNFWKTVSSDLNATLNSPSDSYKAKEPILNSGAGLITITATKKQVERVEKYLETMMKRLSKQVLIDVNIMSVSLSNGNHTGVDWSQIYNFQNGSVQYSRMKVDDVSTFTNSAISGTTAAIATTPVATTTASILKFDRMMSINNLFRFLKTFGDVKSISNPKILTLNNQPAIISSGDQIFYKYTGSTTTATTSTTTSSNEIIDSVFAGILLDVTPEISDDNEIILKINPSISTVRDTTVLSSATTRNIPPDLSKKQLSSVIKTQDGEKIVLGGLISSSEELSSGKVPLLGDIPLVGWIFKNESKTKTTNELIFVITPHIIKKERPLTLKEIGFDEVQKTLDSEKKSKDDAQKGLKDTQH